MTRIFDYMDVIDTHRLEPRRVLECLSALQTGGIAACDAFSVDEIDAALDVIDSLLLERDVD